MTSKLGLSALALLVFAPLASPVVSLAADSSNLSDTQIRQVSPSYPDSRGSYYDWGRGRDGFGYCYEWTYDGYVLNGGAPVSNYLCESRSPSYYSWGRGRDGNTYCYQYTAYGVPMNQGSPVSNYLCR